MSWAERLSPRPDPPWRAVFIMGLLSAALIILAQGGGGSGAALAASGGLTFGAFTLASVTGLAALIRLIIGLGAAIGVAMMPGAMPACVIGLALLAGLERAQYGTVCLVAALFACLAIIVGLARAPTLSLPLSMAAGIAMGAVGIWLSKLAGQVPSSSPNRADGFGLVVFLILGLGLSKVAITILDEPRSYWIAFLFVLRALVPLRHQARSALRFGIGAAVGVVLAVLIELMQPATGVMMGLSVVCAAFGLRYLTHPLPISSAAFSMAVLLGSAPTLSDAAMRAEAVGIVILLVLALTLVLDPLWRIFQDRGEKRGSAT